VIVVQHQVRNFSAILLREQVIFNEIMMMTALF